MCTASKFGGTGGKTQARRRRRPCISEHELRRVLRTRRPASTHPKDVEFHLSALDLKTDASLFFSVFVATRLSARGPGITDLFLVPLFVYVHHCSFLECLG
jgi:hypothetical protein